VRERFGRARCRETIRAALHRLDLSWKKAKKLLGRADPAQRQAFIEQLQDVLAAAQRDQHLLVYLDEAHIHQDADLGYGWAARGQRLWVASGSPGLSAKVSFYGLYLYNEGQVRLWPYPRASGEHTRDALRRLRAEYPDRALTVLWDGAPYHRAGVVRDAAASLGIVLMPLPGYSPDLMPVEALWRWLREDGRDLPSLPREPGRPHPPRRHLPGPRQPRALRHCRPPLGQGSARPGGGETQVLKLDAV
jgi:transposase